MTPPAVPTPSGHQIRGGTSLAVPNGGAWSSSAAHPGKAGLLYQSRDALLADADALGLQLGMNARRTIGALRDAMDGADAPQQLGISLISGRGPSLPPGRKACW